MSKYLYGFVIATVATSAFADEIVSPYDTSGKFSGAYLCIGEASGGVAFDEDLQKWVPTAFNVEDDRYV